VQTPATARKPKIFICGSSQYIYVHSFIRRNAMNWLTKLLGQKEKSGSVAKSRLQMVLVHDRSQISPGLMEQIKDDIIEVIARHLAIDPDNVEVNLTSTQTESRLVAEIPLKPNGRRKSTAYSLE
jgi:cell division topological specificity factor